MADTSDRHFQLLAPKLDRVNAFEQRRERDKLQRNSLWAPLAAKYRLKSNAGERVVSGHWKLAVRRRKSDQWRIDMMDVFCPVVEWETFRSIVLMERDGGGGQPGR